MCVGSLGSICIRYYVAKLMHSSVFFGICCVMYFKTFMHSCVHRCRLRKILFCYLFSPRVYFFTFLCAPVSLGDAPQDFREIVSCSCGRDCSVLVLALPFGSAAGTLFLLNVKREQLA